MEVSAPFQAAWIWLRGQPGYYSELIVPLAITFTMYYGIGFLFLAIDHSGLRWWRLRKCQPAAAPIPWTHVRKIVRYVSLQLFTLYPLVIWIGTPLMRARLDFGPALPDTWTVVKSFAIFAFCTEAYFYHCHALLHHQSIYRYIHKVHHEYTAPIALECLYFHPIESVLQLGTVVAGPLLLGSHITLMYAWTVIALFNVLLHHCGHEVPCDEVPGLLSMTAQHDYHHKALKCNYGVIGVFDWLYGTRGSFDAAHEQWQKQRNNMLAGTEALYRLSGSKRKDTSPVRERREKEM